MQFIGKSFLDDHAHGVAKNREDFYILFYIF